MFKFITFSMLRFFTFGFLIFFGSFLFSQNVLAFNFGDVNIKDTSSLSNGFSKMQRLGTANNSFILSSVIFSIKEIDEGGFYLPILFEFENPDYTGVMNLTYPTPSVEDCSASPQNGMYLSATQGVQEDIAFNFNFHRPFGASACVSGGVQITQNKTYAIQLQGNQSHYFRLYGSSTDVNPLGFCYNNCGLVVDYYTIFSYFLPEGVYPENPNSVILTQNPVVFSGQYLLDSIQTHIETRITNLNTQQVYNAYYALLPAEGIFSYSFNTWLTHGEYQYHSRLINQNNNTQQDWSENFFFDLNLDSPVASGYSYSDNLPDIFIDNGITTPTTIFTGIKSLYDSSLGLFVSWAVNLTSQVDANDGLVIGASVVGAFNSIIGYAQGLDALFGGIPITSILTIIFIVLIIVFIYRLIRMVRAK